jgi:hypothetical protein
MSKTVVMFLCPEEVGEDQAGWWILSLDRTKVMGWLCRGHPTPAQVQGFVDRLRDGSGHDASLQFSQ